MKMPGAAAGVTGCPAIEVRNIEKRFLGITALGGVSFAVMPGQVHCLCGENGAGKSTLIKIMAGSLRPDGGNVLIDGEPVQLASPQDGLARGIGVVYQEIELIPNLSIMENLSLGREPRTALGTVDWRTVRRRAEEVLHLMHVALPAERLVSSLTVAQAQLVAIAKILSMRPRILVFDEPTAALSGGELDTLFSVIDRLKSEGIAIVYISHRLEEIFRLGDLVTVLRDGHAVHTASVNEITEDRLIQLMVGRKTEQRFPQLPTARSHDVVLSVMHLTTPTLVDLTFELHAGEVLGCTGLAGCGDDALARVLVGLEPVLDGEIRIGGVKVSLLSPWRSQARGLSLVPEDRKGQGLVIGASIADNIAHSVLRKHSRFGILNAGRLFDLAIRYRHTLRIRSANLDEPASMLSGGNQQKVVLARILATDPKVLVLDEPTRGIDVGAKAEIYQLIVRMLEQGKGVLLISSEMMEVMALTHRLMVLSEGRLTATLKPPYSDTEILSKALPASQLQQVAAARGDAAPQAALS